MLCYVVLNYLLVGCPWRVSVIKLGGSGGMLPRENFKFKSSEMAINASKTAISNINLWLFHRHIKQQVTTWPPHVRPKFKWINFQNKLWSLTQRTQRLRSFKGHPDIFRSDSLEVPKLSFRLSLRATNSLATATRQSLSVLCLWVFSIVRLLNLVCVVSDRSG